MLPIGWPRDFALLAALCLAGCAIGGTLGHPGLGFGIGALVFLGTSLQRIARLHRWLGESVLRAEPPVHGGMLGDLADRVRHHQTRLQRELEQRGDTIERLREAYSALRDGIVILGAEHTIEWFNRSARDLLGLRHPDDIGRQLVNLVRDPDFVAYLRAAASGADFEFTRSPPRGPVLQVQAAAFGESSKVLFVRDVTALRHLETMRRDFVANISHELRTPLTVISGYLDTLGGLLPGDHPATARALGQMREQAARMESLLRDLLLLARLEGAEEARPEQIDAAALLAATRDAALTACGGSRRIEVDCEAGIVLLANRLQLESVVGNLVFNAVQYTAPGGHVRIVLRREDRELVLGVSDDGIGIEAVHIPRLTERFYRVDKSRSVSGGGTGLGLAIVKHALNRLGGRLEIESQPGVGSTFRCRLPERLLAEP